MKVDFLDLKAINSPYFETYLKIVEETLHTSSFIGGSYCDLFESNFAKYLNAKGCVGVGNGTDALEIAIKSLNLPKGSQIIVPANTFKASCEAILNMGYKAVIVDCDNNYNINIGSLLQAITPFTSAIMIVHLYGRICDVARIVEIARDHNLFLIEDCSQAHGAKIKLDNEILFAGTIGDIGTFSFYPSKNLGAIGDGGCIVSNNETLLSRARSIANHGSQTHEKLSFVGRNSRLDNIQAAFLNLKLQDLDKQNAHRRYIATLYQKYLSKLDSLVLPEIPFYDYQCVWHLYVIRLQKQLEEKRQDLIEFLMQNGIETRIHYPQNLGRMKEIKFHIHTIVRSTLNATNWDKTILSLPMGEHIQEEHVAFIAKKIEEFCNKNT
ncbi:MULTISPECIES: DegT/DnrJ/EryC1/StrS family aminotransferase [unclassified Helicobacter]|uniref:DegT/DnrJ/EryC1/StrS family aminotransferase n=1 Tax=unclassified Helicobacter TaxID=2593540 RepID=UPI000CF05EDC|nr:MULTISPECIES: DegT/DnrJ/EryC1/StrS family aminotransferase [unclassified Helicobacter]